METKKKLILGQFFTKVDLWLKPQILDFIKNSSCDIAYDPFAGAGDLLITAQKLGFSKLIGLDIDENLFWDKNDSLLNIPHINNALIITNPPYLSNYSASRKGIYSDVEVYFSSSNYDDLYLIALQKMLLAQKNVIAIIPETFINSNFQQKNLLSSITILEDNPFQDTDSPVIVACFDGVPKDYSKIKIYKNEKKLFSYAELENLRLSPKNNIDMNFNHPEGWLAVRCVDTTDPKNLLKFDFKENINYDWQNGIKVSSRLLTLIKIDVPQEKRNVFIEKCNSILNDLRAKSSDVIFSPFKGNMKNGTRRRRLDYKTCRAIIENAYQEII